MTDQDWKSWLDYFGATFPEVAAWLDKAGVETVAQWRKVIGRCELADARGAVEQIIDGKVAFPSPWSAFPAAIRGLAEASRRRTEERKPPLEPERSGHWPASAMLKFALDAMKAGKSKKEALAEMNRKFPMDERDNRRVKCVDCLDTGHVEVWHNASVQAVIHSFELKRYRAVALCYCDAGHKRQRDSDEYQPMRYDLRTFCPWRGGDEQLLREWVAERRSVKNMKNYEPAFDAFAETQ